MMDERVQKYVGIPYKPKGQTFEEGMDCVTLLMAYYKELGVTIQESFPDYSYDGTFQLSNLRLYNEWTKKLLALGVVRKGVEDLQVNDVIFFSLTNKDKVELAGAYLGEAKFLYMPHVGKSSISTMTDYWKTRFRYGLEVVKCL
jgi:cell wall-associated NlpC family hydrolase